MEPACDSYGAYGAYGMDRQICICNAMIIFILCIQTSNQGTNKLDTILLESVVLQIIKR